MYSRRPSWRSLLLVGASLLAKQATRWMAPASPVFAGKPAPTGVAMSQQIFRVCRPTGLCGPRQSASSPPAHPARCGWRSRPAP
ncbi:hypothetical protein D0894_09790 [Pseudomonas monteilii]|uniref:Secreted protein n=1 Tax=Pseudomonas monteilii TaxID=76759 RepID=A0A399M8F2_9PSED|nr:hypothetical protein D0894_09790 [Pseudomonas monteilii]